MVEARSYAGPYTIEANGTSGDPVTPPPPSRVGGSRVCEFLRRDTSAPRGIPREPHPRRAGDRRSGALAQGQTTATQSISMSKGPGQPGTHTKIRAGDSVGK